jgi:murein DD-endopeptidase MepM/ murein hydrolase activator NlpD
MKRFFLLLFLLITGTLLYFYFGSSSVTNYVDTYVYDLPYKKGESYTIVQGYGGLFSHKHKAALDFNMPVGTPIHAAREGVVYAFKDNSNEGGPFSKYDGKANYIIIKHSDGSFGCYLHLQQNGVVIKKGTVQKGDLIGYSGNTGFSLRPHLHFAVKKKLNHDKDSYVKTKFNTKSGIVFLKLGTSYEKE